jgi:anti-sigma28 factor (negative regulator of flagellin synthesis)
MIDGVRPKLSYLETSSRKNAKLEGSASAPQSSDQGGVELTAVRSPSVAQAPIDSDKVAAIRDAIRNNAYPIDFQKLAQRMIETDLLGAAGR